MIVGVPETEIWYLRDEESGIFGATGTGPILGPTRQLLARTVSRMLRRVFAEFASSPRTVSGP